MRLKNKRFVSGRLVTTEFTLCFMRAWNWPIGFIKTCPEGSSYFCHSVLILKVHQNNKTKMSKILKTNMSGNVVIYYCLTFIDKVEINYTIKSI